MSAADVHDGFTRMLFIDALIGVGFPVMQVGIDAERGGLARYVGFEPDAGPVPYRWNPEKLGELSVETLQELYLALKMHEVTHAS